MSDLPDAPPDHAAGYAPLTAFAAPAREKSELWRIFAVLLLTMLLTDLADGVIVQAVKAALGPVFAAVALVNVNLGLTPFGVAGGLALALKGGAVFLLALGLVTGRGLGSLLGDRGRMWRDGWRAFWPMAALGLGLLPVLARDGAVSPGQGLGTLLAWMPVTLPLLVALAVATEIVFRGFLQQQLAARWQASWVWMGLPAALFALLQGAPVAAGTLAPLSLLWSLAYAAAAADLTARTGSLGAAIGLQAGIQAQSFFLIGLKGPMTGLALYTLDARGIALAPWMAADFLTLLIGWLAARVLLRV